MAEQKRGKPWAGSYGETEGGDDMQKSCMQIFYCGLIGDRSAAALNYRFGGYL